ncbi:MAG: protease inhibitor I42 family protein [Bacteroidetes bacterium]|jgi:predicted secreted protein|nr:protease inhibitor I42 family protein [Bacteroidota bacterium]
MKSKTLLTLATIAVFTGTLTSCKKGQNNPDLSVKINGLDSGKTVTLINGQTLELTLGNPGDGGYTFNPPQYDSTILKLTDHIRIPPVNSANIGDFGKDTWRFSTLKPGSATLTITATRGHENPVAMFTDTVVIK